MKNKKNIYIIIGFVVILIVASNIYVSINNKEKDKDVTNEPVITYQTKENIIKIKQDIQFTNKNQIIEIGPETVSKDEFNGGMTVSIASGTTKGKLKIDAYVDDELMRSFYLEQKNYNDGICETIPYDFGDRDKVNVKVKFQYVDEKEIDSLDTYNIQIWANDMP